MPAAPPENPPPQAESQPHASPSAAGENFYVFLRYAVALFLFLYGFGKLFGAQFTILDSELDKRLGRVSGFWLTWYYFSYSKVYGAILACTQILGATLLMFRRTTLLAACLLLPVLVNIVLIDIFYGIDLSGLVAAVLLLGAVLILLAIHKEELLDAFWRRQNRLYPRVLDAWPAVVGRWTLRFALAAAAALFMYWVANYNNREPTPIDGTWRVVRMEPAGRDIVLPQLIFFERNRAHLCVFKFNEYSYQPHHFELNPRAHTISLWQEWMKKGQRIFDGHYELFRDRLTLTGSFTDGPVDVTLSLEKAD